MIRHLVLVKFKQGASEPALRDIEKGLEALPAIIPEIKSYEFGLDVLRSDRSYDFGICSSFESLETLKQYQFHPEHVKVAGLIRAIGDNIVVVDYSF